MRGCKNNTEFPCTLNLASPNDHFLYNYSTISTPENYIGIMIFSITIILLFWKCYKNGAMMYVNFWYWLLSLSIMLLHLSVVHSFFLKILLEIHFFFFFLIYLFLAALGLRCCEWAFFLVVVSRGYSSLPCAGLSLWWPLSSWSTGSRCAGSGSQAQ